MAYAERLALYKKIEEIRQRPLIVYVTSSRPNGHAQMASDVIPHFVKQLLAIPKDNKELDLLIVSNGGDAIVPYRIVTMIRERFKKLAALLPYAAYSAATVLALGADEILMHPLSNLGPVDPQLASPRRVPGGEEAVEITRFGSEDLRSYFQFLRSEVGITDQEQLLRAFELVAKEIGTIPIGIARRSTQLALSMGKKLLSLHLNDSTKATTITEALSSSFYHHGYPLSMTEAAAIGLPVKAPEGELETLMWEVWEDIEEEMQCNIPFEPLALVLSNPTVANMLTTVPQINLPANMPQNLLNQAYQNVLNQIQIQAVPPVDYDLFQATVESIRCRSEYRTHGKVNAVRQVDMTIGMNILPITQHWEFSVTQTNQ